MKLILTAILSAIIFYSCNSIKGSGNIITETRNINEFDGIKASGSIDVEVTNDASQMVKVEADDNILPYIVTTIDDGLLEVHYKSNMSFVNTHAKVYVSAPILKRLYVSGSGSINSKDTLKDSEKIAFKVSGSGDINAIVDAPQISGDVSGSGTLLLEGRTRNFSSSVGGSGDIKASKLLSENTNTKVTGSGSARVFSSVQLVAKVSGSGDIYYSGNPTNPVINTSGSGSIQAAK